MPAIEARAERRVLVVDDDEISNEMVATILEEAGYAVAAAADGRSALDRLRERLASVIVLDMDMPVMNGWAFLATKARILPIASIPVVVLSGSPPPRAPRGMVAWLEKPCSFDALLRALRPWC